MFSELGMFNSYQIAVKFEVGVENSATFVTFCPGLVFRQSLTVN